MRLIGLCGRSGSGKGTFSDIASKKGIKVIDCDAVYRDMVSKPSPCLSEIALHFGNSVIKNNSLDRPNLAEIVFSDKEKLTLLNTITHKHIREKINEILSGCDKDATVILDAPTLFESGIDEICDLIIGIIAPDELCKQRIMLRDGITAEKALSRLSNQPANDFIIEHSDIIIYNDSSFVDLEKHILGAIAEIIGEANK